VIRERLGKSGDGWKDLYLLRMLELDIVQPCVESRYTVCRLPLRRGSRPVNARVPNPVIVCVESRYRAWVETRYGVCRIPWFYLAVFFGLRDKCRTCALLVAFPRST
jgi:hypothetical protein